MFDFRIIETPDGNQIIDTMLKTPYSSLTPLQMVEYTEIDTQLYKMERMERKQEIENKNTNKNLFVKFVAKLIACVV